MAPGAMVAGSAGQRSRREDVLEGAQQAVPSEVVAQRGVTPVRYHQVPVPAVAESLGGACCIGDERDVARCSGRLVRRQRKDPFPLSLTTIQSRTRDHRERQLVGF
jgi:hypothetical protein